MTGLKPGDWVYVALKGNPTSYVKVSVESVDTHTPTFVARYYDETGVVVNAVRRINRSTIVSADEMKLLAAVMEVTT